MFANLATAIPTGALVTLSLLYGMHSLITMEPIDVVEDTHYPKIDFVRVKRNEDTFREEFEKPDLVDPIEPPPMSEVSDPVEGMPVMPAGYKPPVPTGTGAGEGFTFMSDGPLVTIVRVEPTYPSAAITRGLEGFVTVQFDVFPDGSVGNITVLESSSSIFERAAIQAAKRFRYKARVVDGEPLMTTGVQYRFKFEMST